MFFFSFIKSSDRSSRTGAVVPQCGQYPSLVTRFHLAIVAYDLHVFNLHVCEMATLCPCCRQDEGGKGTEHSSNYKSALSLIGQKCITQQKEMLGFAF